MIQTVDQKREAVLSMLQALGMSRKDAEEHFEATVSKPCILRELFQLVTVEKPK